MKKKQKKEEKKEKRKEREKGRKRKGKKEKREEREKESNAPRQQQIQLAPPAVRLSERNKEGIRLAATECMPTHVGGACRL